MKEFCTVITFALMLTFFTVLLSVALWNEGCNKQVIPHPVKYAGRNAFKSEENNAELPMLTPNHSILILPQ